MHDPDETARLRLRLRQQELVAQFGSFAMAAEALQPVLDEVSVVAADGLETRFAKVLQHLPEEGGFLVAAGIGWKPGVGGQVRLGDGHASPAGYSFIARRPVITDDAAAEHRFEVPPVLQEHGIRSFINVLVQAGQAPPFGVLEADSTHRGEFAQEDVAFLQALGNILAIAVEAQRRQAAMRGLLGENRALLAEKDLLMQEVHHRVMNSLDMVKGLLSLQAGTLPEGEAKVQLRAAAARILTIAAVHRQLHRGGSVAAGDAAAYLRGLLAQLDQLQAGEAPTALDVVPFDLAADELPPLGLIVSELVTNAAKHGGRPVRVAIHRVSGGLEIAVDDAGAGFPLDHDPAGGRGLGMRILRSLAGGGEGAVRVDRSVPHGRILVRTSWGGLNPP